MNKINYLITIMLVLCSFSALGFFYNDNFITSTHDSALYTNRSVVNQVQMYPTGGVLNFNGTNAGSGLATFLMTKQTIDTEKNGTLSFTIQVITNGGAGNDHIYAGVGSSMSKGLFLSNDGTDLYLTAGGGSRLCPGTYKAIDGAIHTITMNITRIYNSTGSAKNTTFTGYYDGVLWCSNTTTGALPLYANLTDNSFGGSGHKYYIDSFQFSDRNFSVSCLPKPAIPIFAFDDFSYNTYVDSCYWYPSPATNILPSNGQLCYNAAANTQAFKYYLSGEGNFYGHDTFTETFDLSLTNTAYLEKELSAVLLNGGSRKIYTLDFFSIGTDTYVQYLYMVNSTTALGSLCANCWNPNISNQVKITTYNYDASGYTVLNKSSNTFQAVQPNTFSVQINNGTIYFNLPIITPSADNSNIPDFATWYIDGGEFCLDNYKLYSGILETAQQTQLNGTPYLQVGEKCSVNWECFTGLCNYLGSCDKKGNRAACVNNFECLSGVCRNSFCTKPTLWQLTDTVKTDIVGSDTATNNLMSIVISLVISIIVAVMVFNMGAGIIGAAAGGMVFVLALFFFTMVGWLSPFILIGLIIVIILLIMLLFFLGSGG